MTGIYVIPVIASVLVLGILGLSQEAWAAIDINRLVTEDPILKPINFTVTNTGKNPITVTEIAIYVDQDPSKSKVQPFTFILNVFLQPGQSFFFDPTLLDLNGDPVQPKKRTLVRVFAEEVEDTPRDPDDPKVKKVKKSKKI